MTTVILPGGPVFLAAGEHDQPGTRQPEWGVYADNCWEGWPGRILREWPDLGVPSDGAVAVAAIMEAFARARSGQAVLVGCRGGIGRTGTILACLAVLAGVPTDRAVPWVRSRYRPDAVETQGQIDWVVHHFAQDDRVIRHARRSRERLVKAETARIREAMRRALGEPEHSPVLEWAVPDVLAVTQRPLRANPEFGLGGRSYPAEARPVIEEWITRLMTRGIRSLVVLTSHKELAHYDAPTAPEGGLLALYASRGLRVVHLPFDDPAHDDEAKVIFDAAIDVISEDVAVALAELPLPAAMHCSAAIDRSPPVAARIAFLSEVGALSWPSPTPNPA